MKTLDELFKEFGGKTSLQQDEHLRKLVGAEVQIVGELSVIAPDYLSCWNFDSRWSHGNSITITHEGEQLRKQLLEYSSQDGVRMDTRFTGVTFGETDHYTFALVSIVRLYTREAKEKEKREAEESKKSRCFVATAAYGAPNPSVSLFQEYRDRILNKAFVGRAFVRFYYLASPPLARFIEASDRRRFIARIVLGPVAFLARLQLKIFRKRERQRTSEA